MKYVADGELDGGVVFGGDDFVGEVAFAGEVDVSHLFVDVDAAFHVGFHCSFPACVHLWLLIFNYLLN